MGAAGGPASVPFGRRDELGSAVAGNAFADVRVHHVMTSCTNCCMVFSD
jgi:hypothetical protein